MNVETAKVEIAAILAQLENQTGQLVESIGVEAIDVTCYGDDKSRHQMVVKIEMRRLPGHQW